MLQQWRPAAPVEALLVEQMTICPWRIRRCAPAEAAILTMRMRQMAPAVDAMFGPEVSAPGRRALAFETLSQDGDTTTRAPGAPSLEELEHVQANRPDDSDGPGHEDSEKPPPGPERKLQISPDYLPPQVCITNKHTSMRAAPGDRSGSGAGEVPSGNCKLVPTTSCRRCATGANAEAD